MTPQASPPNSPKGAFFAWRSTSSTSSASVRTVAPSGFIETFECVQIRVLNAGKFQVEAGPAADAQAQARTPRGTQTFHGDTRFFGEGFERFGFDGCHAEQDPRRAFAEQQRVRATLG